MIKVVLVDDHKIIRDGLKALLSNNNEIEVVGECSNGNELIEFLKHNEIRVVLMDINMPELNGIDTTTIITKEFPKVRVLALSMHKEDRFISKILKEGALGYVLKSTSGKELIEAIKKVAAGENYFSEEVVAIMMSKYTKNGPIAKATAGLVSIDEFTSREVEIIKLVANGLTNNKIADTLIISPRTVDTHRRNILQKLGVHNTAGIVKFAFKHELVE